MTAAPLGSSTPHPASRSRDSRQRAAIRGNQQGSEALGPTGTAAIHTSVRRVASMDLLRMVCVLAVVVLHATSAWMDDAEPVTGIVVTNGLLLWAVPCLFVLSGFVVGLKPSHLRDSRWLANRVRRLAIPYLGWTAVYYVAIAALTVSAGYALPPITMRMLLTGNLFPLFWFLPTLIYVTVLTWPVRSREAMFIVAVVGFLSWPLLGWLGSWAQPPLSSAAGFVSGLMRFVALFTAGMWISNLDTRSLRPLRVPALLAFGAAVAGQALLNLRLENVGAAVPGFHQEVLGSIAGVALVAVVTTSAMTYTNKAFSFALGLYMTHILWCELATRMWPAGTFAWLLWTTLTTAFMLVGSAGMIWLLSRHPASRVLVT